MSNRVSPNIIPIIFVVLICCLNPDVALPQNFRVSNNLNDAELIRIEFRYDRGNPIPILKQYKDKLILQVDGIEKEIKLPEKSKLFFDGGSFFGLYQREDFKETESVKTNFSVYSMRGQKVWSVSENLIWDQFEPHWIIDPIYGAALKIESSVGKVTYFDSRGNPISINVFDASGHNYERSLIGAFTPMDGYFAIARQTQENIESNRSTLILFDRQQNVIFEKSFIQSKITQLKFSQDGKKIGFSGYHPGENGTIESKITQVIDKRGNVLSSFPVLSLQISFSEAGRYIILNDGKTVYHADLSRRKTLWKKKLGGDGRIITNIDISPDGNYVAILSGMTRYQNLSYTYYNLNLSLFDGEGELLREQDYSDYAVIEPILHFSPDGRSVAVGFKNGWSLLRRLDK